MEEEGCAARVLILAAAPFLPYLVDDFSRIVELYIDSGVIAEKQTALQHPSACAGLAGLFDFNMSVFFKIDFSLHFFNQLYCNIKYSAISIKDKLLIGCYSFFLDSETFPSELPVRLPVFSFC